MNTTIDTILEPASLPRKLSLTRIVYPISLKPLLVLLRGGAARRHTTTALSANVWALGMTSLLTDVSTEMVTSALPLLLVFHLHASPAALGAVDALQQGAVGLARLLGGLQADASRNYKRTAAAGYLLSALCRVGFILSTLPAHFALFLSVDRLGKGIRTGPRDALLALSAPPEQQARAFGVHRTLDTAGAMLGPLVTYLVLRVLPGNYTSIFVLSLAFAALGVGVLLTYATDPAESPAEPSLSARGDLVRLLSDRRVRRLALVATLLGVTALGDHVLYVLLQRRFGLAPDMLPLLYVATPAAYMVLAYPVGWLADNYSRRQVLCLGYCALLCAYLVTLLELPLWLGVGSMVTLLGLHYAATDGVLMALGSACLPRAAQATGLAALATTNSLGRLIGSLAFGLLWSRTSEVMAVVLFALGAAIGIAVCFWLLSHRFSPALSGSCAPPNS